MNAMAKSDPQVITLTTFLLFITILILSPTCQADRSKSDGPDSTMSSKEVTKESSVCECGLTCGTPCLYPSPPPPYALPPPVASSPPEAPLPELNLPPPPVWPWPTPMPPYTWYIPPPPRGDVYAAHGGFEFYKPSLAWHKDVSLAYVLVCGGILVLLL